MMEITAVVKEHVAYRSVHREQSSEHGDFQPLVQDHGGELHQVPRGDFWFTP